MRQIVLDTETTGLDPKLGHRIIEIGCVELVDRQLTGNVFHQYINPEREIDSGAQAVHGISNDFLADKPLFSEISTDFLEFIRGAELIIHNAAFDIKFINYEFSLLVPACKVVTHYCTVLDTLLLARRLFPGKKASLDALTKRYNLTHFNRAFHGALLDSQILAQVYLAMTGGQDSLFFAEENSASMASQNIQRVDAERVATPIIRASAQELVEHEAYLKKLGSDCLWLQLDGIE